MLKSAKSIGELIYYYRLINRFSQQDLARKLNVTISAVSSWERGINKPTVDIAILIANDMAISLHDFYVEKIKTTNSQMYSFNDTLNFHDFSVSGCEIIPNRHQRILTVTFKIVLFNNIGYDQIKHLHINFENSNEDFNFNHSSTNHVPFNQEHNHKMSSSISSPYLIESYSYNYTFDSDLIISLRYLDETKSINLPFDFIQGIALIHQTEPIEPNQILEFIRSNSFCDIILYFANNNQLDQFQMYFYTKFSSVIDDNFNENSKQTL
jgi:transcriptional regulator with XRE-family HTH domain